MNNTQQTLAQHYGHLLNIQDPWLVSAVDLDTENLQLLICVGTKRGAKLPCPACKKLCRKEDHRERRTWRHLDTMQFKTLIACRLPRISCKAHGILSVKVPWADEYSRFTELFEKFAIDVLKASKTVASATLLLGLSWHQIHDIQKRAVQRGISRRRKEAIRHLGIDEKNFLAGHSYATLLADLDNVRVWEVAQDRTEEAAAALINTLSERQKRTVQAVAMDMWPAFRAAAQAALPSCDIVHDRYHVSGYLSKAVDAVRKQENRLFLKSGSGVLKGTKYLWLRNPENWSRDDRNIFRSLAVDEMKVGRAWSMKESFRHFWEYRYAGAARDFFNRWYFWATHSRLKPVIEAAKTLKRHASGIFAYLKHRITNAAVEGLNSKIQSIKSDARGFRSFENYRVAILFHCGRLNLYP